MCIFESIIKLPIKISVLFTQQFHLEFIQVLLELSVKVLPLKPSFIHECTEFLVCTLKIEDSNYRSLLARELRNIAELVAG